MTPQALLAPARLAGQSVLRSQTDERLVDLARAGHEAAFEAIVARYRRPLLRYCGGILPGERAEDAVQQTFVKAYDAMRRDDADLNLRPWLYRIAHNTSLNTLRDRGLRHDPLDSEIDGVEPPDQAAERRQGIREVLAAVQALPARQRDAILLRELEGRSYEEIAGQLGVTGGAVRQLLNRARHTVRAGVTAITPFGLLIRLPSGPADEAVDARVAEAVGGAGLGAAAAKVGATVLVTGAVAGGVAGVPDLDNDHDSRADEPSPAQPAQRGDGPSPRNGGVVGQAPAEGDERTREGDQGRGRGRGRGRGGGDDSGPSDRSGPGGGGGSNSGPGGGGSDSSGPGSGSGTSDGDSSGSGGGSGSGSDSGSGSSGSGSGSSGSGSGSSGSGSGSSGSGGDSSGSGSGSSGSGSDSGSGSGSEDPLEID